MEKMHILPTRSTPEVILDNTTGIIQINGRSLSQNSISFFEVIFSWLRTYFKEPAKLTTIDLKLEYFNSTSNKIIIDLLFLVKKLANEKHAVHIKWHYHNDDEDLLIQGQEMEKFLNIPFECISYE